MAKVDIHGYACEVESIDEFARGPDGTCAFCAGDPCLEHPDQTGETAMKQFDKDTGGQWDTCPCCDGRPT